MNSKFGLSFTVRPLRANNCYCRMCFQKEGVPNFSYIKRGELVLEITATSASGSHKSFLCRKHANELKLMLDSAVNEFSKE